MLEVVITDPAGTGTFSIAVPNDASLVGLELFHQWGVIDPTVNPLGIVMSNAGRALVGN